jgi:hypothetical protein
MSCPRRVAGGLVVLARGVVVLVRAFVARGVVGVLASGFAGAGVCGLTDGSAGLIAGVVAVDDASGVAGT